MLRRYSCRHEYRGVASARYGAESFWNSKKWGSQRARVAIAAIGSDIVGSGRSRTRDQQKDKEEDDSFEYL